MRLKSLILLNSLAIIQTDFYFLLSAPVRNYKIKGIAKPWISGDIIELMKHRDKLYKKPLKKVP